MQPPSLRPRSARLLLSRAFALAVCAACAIGAVACATASDDTGGSHDSSVASDSGTHPIDSSFDATTDGGGDASDGACLAPKKICSGVCTDVTSDNKNCGDCGKPCADAATCVSGACGAIGCGKDEVSCPDGKCANLLSDADHCGDCSTKCGLDASGAPKICKDAVCTLDCSTKTACPGGATCVDLKTDDANCGACGHACPTGQKCALGTCVACPPGGSICGAACVDLTSDPTNCGACGTACTKSESCIASKCTCPGALTDCSGLCKDLKNDGTNCGACGTVCGTGLVCADGTCSATCPSPKIPCGGSCIDITSDSKNCGACGTVCGTGTFCVSSKCTTGTCGRFTGATGTAWEARATEPSQGGQPGWSDLAMAGDFYSVGGTDLALYSAATDTWTSTLAKLPTSMTSWVAPLWVAPDTMYSFGANVVLQYTISTNTWTTLKSGLSLASSAQSTHDDTGHLYTLQSDGNIAQYDTTTGTVTTLTFAAGSLVEPRMAWESCSRKLYLAPSFISGTLYSYDPATKTTATLKANPDSFMNDVFCSDRSGHLYAAGASSGMQMWQYTVATDTWTKIPDLPVDHGDNGACAVTQDGWLYTTPGSASAVHRIQLK